MKSKTDYESDVGTMNVYASGVPDPDFIEEPSTAQQTQGVAPLETLPAQWWNWFLNQATSRFGYYKSYVSNLFSELGALLGLVDLTPDGTTTSTQLKSMFQNNYPNFISKFIHTIASLWTYQAPSTEGDVTTTQNTRLAVFENINTSDASTTPATVTNTYNTKYVNTLPVKLGGIGADNAQDGLENLCTNVPSAGSSVSTDAVLFKSGTNVKKVTLEDMSPTIYNLIKDSIATDNLYSLFIKPFLVTQAISAAKTIAFPATYDYSTDSDIIFKCIFANGQNVANPYAYMTLTDTTNNKTAVIVSYQNGSLAPLPIHEMTEDGSTVYKVLDPNTCLEMYYNADYDGEGTPAWVVIGNPVVLKSTDYIIYSDGQYEQLKYSTDEQWTGKYWTDGKKIYNKYVEATITSYSDSSNRRQFNFTQTISDINWLTNSFGNVSFDGATTNFGLFPYNSTNSNMNPSESSGISFNQSTNTVTCYLNTLISYGHTSITFRIVYEYTKTTD